jgi:hypothetical protein
MLESQPVEGEKPRSPMARTGQERRRNRVCNQRQVCAEGVEKTTRKENESGVGSKTTPRTRPSVKIAVKSKSCAISGTM